MTSTGSISKCAPRQERAAFGKSQRDSIPREAHADWPFEHARARAEEYTQRSTAGRIASLLPLRNERMRQSLFAFYRASALLMAIDLLHVAPSKLFVQLCGDAHLRNFGTFGNIDGSIGFDFNDFDETHPGPFEWDLKRLAASVVLAGLEAKHDMVTCKDAVRVCVATYRQRMKELAECAPFEPLLRRATHDALSEVVKALASKAKHKSHARLLEDLTVAGVDSLVFKDEPPLLARVSVGERARFADAIDVYRRTLSPPMQATLAAWRLVDVAFKVVGIGSVGLAAYVALLTTGDHDHHLILQFKEARVSAVATALAELQLPTESFAHQGQRISEGQRAMQSQQDPFIGFTSVDTTPMLVRRLAENKAAVDDASVQGGGLTSFAKTTGSVMALSHAVTGDPVAIAGYLGNSDAFDESIAKFAASYTKQVEDDYAQFVASTQ